MIVGKTRDDRLACFVCNLNLSGLTITRVILWLTAITVVSFVCGFGILAVSGELPSGGENKASPFRYTAMLTPNTTTVMLDDATTGCVRITMGAGELTVRDGAPAAVLMEATVFSKAPEWQPVFEQATNRTTKSASMIEKGHKGKEWFAVHSPNNWEIQLNGRVPLNLSVNVGAGDSHLDLGALNLTRLVVSNGAGETEIALGDYHGGKFTAEIHNGVGDLSLIVPKNSNTRISIHQGVGDVEKTGFEQHDGFYTTAGYSSIQESNEILIEQGVGDIRIKAI